MPLAPTARLGLPRYEDGEPAAFSSQVNAVSSAVDAKAAMWEEGTFAARPVAGKAGRIYHATDHESWYMDNGVEWRYLPTLASGAKYAEQAAPPASTEIEVDKYRLAWCNFWAYQVTVNTVGTYNVFAAGSLVGLIKTLGNTTNGTGGSVGFWLPPGAKWRYTSDYTGGGSAGLQYLLF